MAPKRGRPSIVIKLPPPLFKEPAAPGDAAAANNNNGTSQARMEGPLPILGKETMLMQDALKSATVKLAEIIRYHSDFRQSRPGQPAQIPRELKISLGQHIERFDQLCDVVEAHLLRAITVLTRDAKREEARKEAERREAAAKAAAEAARAAEEAAAALAAQPKPETTAQTATDNDVQMQDAQVKVEVTEESPAVHSQKLPARLINATPSASAVNMVSLSPLQPSSEFSMIMGDEPPQQALSLERANTTSPRVGESSTASGINRLKRAPSLKLDLSSMAPLTGSEPGGLPQDKSLPSPVTLAPKTAKPKADDPMGAIGLSFTSGLPFAANSTPFAAAQQLPSAFAGLANVNLANQSSNLIPDLLSTLEAGNNSNNPGIQTNSVASSFAPLPVPASTSIPASDLPQPPANVGSGDNIDIIDLTTPVIETMSMSANLGTGGVIDLTVDSPTAPLKNVGDAAQQDIADILSASNPVISNNEPAGATGVMDDGLGLDLIAETAKPTTGDDILSVLENTAQPPTAEATEPTEKGAEPFETLPTDATSLLASLTEVSNSNSGAETSIPEGGQNNQDNPLASLEEFDLSSFSGLHALDSEMNLGDTTTLGGEDFSSMFGGAGTSGDGIGGGLDFGGSGGMDPTNDLMSGMGMDMSDLDFFNFGAGDSASGGLGDQATSSGS
ncbi:hypothetical protein FRC02_004104 [Tulasnella sp. 418]|nr:hypothetical protein FRC02_004104 [Tulasnella sp. 418]